MVRKLDEVLLDSISEELYKRDIYFFSRRERANLKGIRELFRDPQKFNMDYYKPIVVKDSLKYVYPEKPPAYHKDSTCQRLNSNYRNYEIPVPIQEKSIDEILTFRKWFIENNCHLMSVIEYIYAIQKRFPYVGEINPATIEKDNSGVEEKENYSIEGLDAKLSTLLNDCDSYFFDNPPVRELIVRYQKWTFLAYTYGPIKNNNSGFTDEELRDFLRTYDKTFKEPVKNYLIEYYRLRFNPELQFDGLILDKMGFTKCKNCLID